MGDVYAEAGTAVATASASGASASVAVTTGAAVATASASGATVLIIPPWLGLIVAVPDPHPHLPADHENPVAVGTEFALVAVVALVSGVKLVRAFRLG